MHPLESELQIVSGTYGAAALTLFIIATMSGCLGQLRIKSWGAVLGFTALQTSDVGVYVFAIRYLPLTEMTIFDLTAPLVVAVLGRLLLLERLSWQQVCAILLGFGGTLVVLLPSTVCFAGGRANWPWYAVVAAMTHTSLVVSQSLFARASCQNESGFAIAFYTSVVIMLVYLPFATSFLPHLDTRAVERLALGGECEIGGVMLFLLALQHRPAILVVPIRYTQLPWAAVADWLLFGLLLSLWTSLGAALILLSGLMLYGGTRSRSHMHVR
jgi:drug/metabolite transporter (DMT)-like permease